MKTQSIVRKYILVLAIMLTSFVMMFSLKSEAATRSISLNNTWVSGYCAEGVTNWYDFTVTKPGWVSIDYQGFDIRDAYFEILDGDMTKSYYSSNVYYSSDDAPITRNTTIAMEPGSYRIKVWPCGSNAGSYRVRGAFTAANTNEKEPNNLFTSAQTLSSGVSVSGFISADDRVDFYKIVVPSTQKVKFTYLAKISDSYFELYNGDLISAYNKNVYYASEESPLTHVYEETLNKGTYYVKISPCGDNTGRYSLKVTLANTATQVTPTRANGFVKSGSSWKWYVNGTFKSSYNGIVKGTINGKTAWYYVKNGVYTKASGLAKKADGSSSTWYYVLNGVFTKKSGLAKRADGSSTAWFYVQDGVFTKKSGLAKRADGSSTAWFYVQNGVFTKKSGLAKRADGSSTTWFYVLNGVFTKNTGLAKKADGSSSTWYYVKAGVFSKENAIAKKADGSSTTRFFVNEGVFASTYTGYFTLNGVRYKIVKGVVQ